MTNTPFSPTTPDETQILDVYHQVLDGWNHRDAEAMMEPFTEDGIVIGFDGSQYLGKADAIANLQPIFESHPTAPYVAKVREIRQLSPEIAILRSIAGMIPPGQTKINPNVNTLHTVVAVKQEGEWKITLYQNTPTQFHGRPELVQQMTEELQELVE